MNRELKFRVQATDKQGVKYWVFIDLKKSIKNPLATGKTHGNMVDLKTLGQFTGKKDKKGIDIYEGDILQNKTFKKKFDNRSGRKDKNGNDVYEYYVDTIITKDVVSFDKHWCSFSFTKISEIGELEIIGNIIENKNLLTK